MTKCLHSAQDWYIETATGRSGCYGCDATDWRKVIEREPKLPWAAEPADHSSCSRRRFGSGCVPFNNGGEE